MKKLDFIEAEAKANFAFHLACAETLAKEANTLLTVLLTGAGASFGFVINLVEKGASQWLLYGLGAVSAYLFAIAALTTRKCLWVDVMYPPANEPKNLNQTNLSIAAVRRSELKNKQTYIDMNKARNEDVGDWLNRCRMLAAATPLVFAVAALASFLYPAAQVMASG